MDKTDSKFENMNKNKTTEQQCCPKFDPEPWHDKEFDWNDKLFIKDTVKTFFYMPINFGKVISRIFKVAENAGASTPDFVCLSDHKSLWKMDMLLAVDKKIPNVKMTRLSGHYFSRVYEGNYNNTNKWCADFEDEAKLRNMVVGKMYMWYTTCPKCAKKYGKNYVVIVSKVFSSE